MKDKELLYKEKLKRIQLIQERLPIEQSIFYSLEDLQDAYLMTKANIFKERMNLVIDKLELTKDKNNCHYLYRELEDLEEMLFLVEKKYSRNLKKALKVQKSPPI